MEYMTYNYFNEIHGIIKLAQSMRPVLKMLLLYLVDWAWQNAL